MTLFKLRCIFFGLLTCLLSLAFSGCGISSSKDGYFGKTEAPSDNTLRYISGSEPESLDPIVGTGQPEARVYMALYDGLVEYHPKTMDPIAGIAERWQVSRDGTEYLFHLRKNAKFSNGDPITAKDFLYTFRRALSPEAASRNGYLGYYIKYAEPYNSGDFFVKGPDGKLLLEKDFTEAEEKPDAPAAGAAKEEKIEWLGRETEIGREMKSPKRLIASHDNLKLAQSLEKNQKLKEVFKFKAADLKNAAALSKKVKDGADPFSAFLKQQISPEAIDACNESACDDAAKAKLAEALNTLAEGDLISSKDWFASVELKNAAKFAKAIAGENKKREDAAKKIDEEIGKLTDEKEKEAKLKGKKPQIAKLFYANRAYLEDYFQDSLEKSPLVPIEGKDIGLEAIDDYTFRIKLYQPAPYFLGVLGHQFFRVLHQPTIEKFGKEWAKAKNIVTSGPFKVYEHRPYDRLIVERDKNYWDAANVKLDKIEFYPMEEATTMMNLYKAGSVDAVYNHTPPAAWLDEIKPRFKDEYLDFPEVAVEYYAVNTTKAPMNNVKVRQALALGIDRMALAKFRKVTKPLADYTPEGIFPKYEEARKKVYDTKLKELKIPQEQWDKRLFDPERARQLLAEAGYPVEKDGNGWKCPKFPADKVDVTYNTAESNKATAEFVQAQWRQNLGITVTLKNLEWKSFLPMVAGLEHQGVSRKGWVGDYMDPFTFLSLLYTANNDSASGWHDKKFDELLDKANAELDEQKRFELMAEAELYVSLEQPFIPLMTNATNWIKKPYVKGFYPNPGTLHPWKFVYIEKDKNKWDKNVDNILKDKDEAVDKQIDDLMAAQKKFEEELKAQPEIAKSAKAE